MTADRVLPDVTTNPTMSGAAYSANLKGEGEALWDRVITPAEIVGGNGNAIRATCSPPLKGAPADGQRFRLTLLEANTASWVRINLDNTGYFLLADILGLPLNVGDLTADETIEFAYHAASNKYRLTARTVAQIHVLATGSIADLWVTLCNRAILTGSGRASDQFVFTGGLYSHMIVQVTRLSTATALPFFNIELRNGSGAIVALRTPSRLSNVADSFVARAVFDIDVGTGNKQHHGRLYSSQSGGTMGTVSGRGSSSLHADRVRFAIDVSFFDSGWLFAKGLRATP